MKDKVLLGILIVGAFLLRTLPQWNKVFVDGQVWFRGVDSWYRMRLVDVTVHNFPVLLRWDMYSSYPEGTQVAVYPLLTWLITGIGKLGFNYEVVAALLPPILGALILVPIFLLGKELFNKWVGLMACFLVAVLPGELLHRSLLGFTDQHILESFLMVTTILFLALMSRHKKPGYVIGAGVTLGLYVLNWHGAAFFPFIIGVWILVKFFRNTLTLTLCRNISVVGVIALFISGPYLLFASGTLENVGALVALAVLPWILSVPMQRKIFVRMVIGLLVAVVILLSLPSHNMAFYGFRVLGIGSIFWGFGTWIEEATPSDLSLIFNCYGLSFFLFLGGLYFIIKNKTSSLFLVWTVILLLAVIGQRRWGYYFTIPVALLASYFAFIIGNWVTKNVKVAVVIVICLFMVLPTIKGTIGIVTLPNNINSDWYEACVWLEENTPKPFPNDPDKAKYYFDDTHWASSPHYAYEAVRIEGEADYGVLAWWDYGHWIIRVGRRVPITSPTRQGVSEPSLFLSAQTEEAANEIIKTIQISNEVFRSSNIQYVVISRAELTGKFYAIVRKAGLPVERVEELRPNSMVVRLWNGQTATWKEIYRNRTVKVFGRLQ